MKKYWLLLVLVVVLCGLTGCGKRSDVHEEISETSTDVVISKDDYELKLIERESEDENTDFEAPSGKVAFGILKGLSDKSLIMEYEDSETYEITECRVPLDVQEQERVPDLDVGENIVVFYDGTIEGDLPREINEVYAIYPQDEVPHAERFVEHEIVFLTEYMSYAWGLQFHGCFMDADGRVYSFEFEEDNYGRPPESNDRAAFFRSLEKIRKTTKPEKVVDASVVKQVCDIGCKIDAGADYYGLFAVEYDSGVHRSWFCHPETREPIMLDMSGEDIMRLEDENAKKLVEMYDSGQIY